MATGEVVDHGHFMALVEESQARMGTDVAGTAGDEKSHG
jgi:hypothetical protein